ncbi:MAG: glutaminyl-peptide cyclotransferase [Flavisolibacter sp.]|nr:glutaminyl-peptide cyclotransferase [Flavisolibacter sp.]
MKNIIGFLPSLLIFLSIGCNNSNGNNDFEGAGNAIPISTPSIVSTLPHDTSSFTEGLEFYDSTLIESGGNYGHSKLFQYDPKSGKVLKELKLDDKYFGEGITVLHDTLYQLTYREKTAFLYDVKTFKKIKEIPFEVGEGWGLTNDGKNIIASTGSSNLYYFEPGTLKLLKTLNITENGAPVPNINELEYVDGYVYANQWQYNYIVKIDPSTATVIAKLDLSAIVDTVNKEYPGAAELNGIAYSPVTKKFYVTGKHWPRTFEIQF